MKLTRRECEFINHCDFKHVCDGPSDCTRREFYIERLKKQYGQSHNAYPPPCPLDAFCKCCHNDPDCCDERAILEGFIGWMDKKKKTEEREKQEDNQLDNLKKGGKIKL